MTEIIENVTEEVMENVIEEAVESTVESSAEAVVETALTETIESSGMPLGVKLALGGATLLGGTLLYKKVIKPKWEAHKAKKAQQEQDAHDLRVYRELDADGLICRPSPKTTPEPVEEPESSET